MKKASAPSVFPVVELFGPVCSPEQKTYLSGCVYLVSIPSPGLLSQPRKQDNCCSFSLVVLIHLGQIQDFMSLFKSLKSILTQFKSKEKKTFDKNKFVVLKKKIVRVIHVNDLFTPDSNTSVVDYFSFIHNNHNHNPNDN